MFQCELMVIKSEIFNTYVTCFYWQTGKAASDPDNENASNRAAECIAERIEVFKSAFGETEEQLNQEKYVGLTC